MARAPMMLLWLRGKKTRTICHNTCYFIWHVFRNWNFPALKVVRLMPKPPRPPWVNMKNQPVIGPTLMAIPTTWVSTFTVASSRLGQMESGFVERCQSTLVGVRGSSTPWKRWSTAKDQTLEEMVMLITQNNMIMGDIPNPSEMSSTKVNRGIMDYFIDAWKQQSTRGMEAITFLNPSLVNEWPVQDEMTALC